MYSVTPNALFLTLRARGRDGSKVGSASMLRTRHTVASAHLCLITCKHVQQQLEVVQLHSPKNCHFLPCIAKKQDKSETGSVASCWGYLSSHACISWEDGRGTATRWVAKTTNKLSQHHFYGLHVPKKELAEHACSH